MIHGELLVVDDVPAAFAAAVVDTVASATAGASAPSTGAPPMLSPSSISLAASDTCFWLMEFLWFVHWNDRARQGF